MDNLYEEICRLTAKSLRESPPIQPSSAVGNQGGSDSVTSLSPLRRHDLRVEGTYCFETLEYAHLIEPTVMSDFRGALIGALHGAVMAVEYILEVRIDVRIEPGSIKALYTIDFEVISSAPATIIISAVKASVDSLPNLESNMKDVLNRSLGLHGFDDLSINKLEAVFSAMVEALDLELEVENAKCKAAEAMREMETKAFNLAKAMEQASLKEKSQKTAAKAESSSMARERANFVEAEEAEKKARQARAKARLKEEEAKMREEENKPKGRSQTLGRFLDGFISPPRRPPREPPFPFM